MLFSLVYISGLLPKLLHNPWLLGSKSPGSNNFPALDEWLSFSFSKYYIRLWKVPAHTRAPRKTLCVYKWQWNKDLRFSTERMKWKISLHLISIPWVLWVNVVTIRNVIEAEMWKRTKLKKTWLEANLKTWHGNWNATSSSLLPWNLGDDVLIFFKQTILFIWYGKFSYLK